MKIIGISGAARSGKDTFGDLLIEILQDSGIKCVKNSFANELKLEVRDFLQDKLGIDSFTQDDKEKKIIRPMLVTWGTEIRRALDPDVWIKSVEKNLDLYAVNIITDVRFKNEQDWIKSYGGKSVFLSRVLEDGSSIQPANEIERSNNQEVSANSDHLLTWSTIKDHSLLRDVAFETMSNIISTEEISLWKQTYPL
jgi:hypothetical protein